ncbi:MAG: hypothetical protein ACYDEY_13625, partial [Acidimicrobiales bacterium]
LTIVSSRAERCGRLLARSDPIRHARLHRWCATTGHGAGLNSYAPASPIGTPQGRRAVRSRRGRLDKQPWKALDDHTGVVEDIFVRQTLLGERALPFRLLPPAEAVIPYDGTQLLSGNDDRIDRYPLLADWWRRAERTWEEHKGAKSKLSFLGQLDYMHKLAAQFPAAPIRVVYSKSGNFLAAAVVSNPRIVIDHSLYWAATTTLAEARYLTAILNSSVIGEFVRPYQSVGAFGPRHFDKYVWYVPVPEFDPSDPSHHRLVDLAEQAEDVAESVELGDRMGFQEARRLIREALVAEGIAAEIDREVSALVDTGNWTEGSTKR